MDSRSLNGMGSYFGEDDTAASLVKLAAHTEQGLALERFGMP
jgi:hypothetical protein